MLYRSMDLLACPNCRHHPLKLIVIEEEVIDRKPSQPLPLCDFYCGFLGEKIEEGKEYPCSECVRREIKLGVLICPNCGMWFPISKGIPVMFASKKDRERAIGRFLQEYGDKIPREVWELIKSYKEGE